MKATFQVIFNCPNIQLNEEEVRELLSYEEEIMVDDISIIASPTSTIFIACNIELPSGKVFKYKLIDNMLETALCHAKTFGNDISQELPDMESCGKLIFKVQGRDNTDSSAMRSISIEDPVDFSFEKQPNYYTC